MEINGGAAFRPPFFSPAPVSSRDGVTCAYGYRYGEVLLPHLPPVKSSATISPTRVVDLSVRPVVMSSLGCHVAGAALPHPCPQDPDTMRAGVSKRFAVAPPVPEQALVHQLRDFVRVWVRKNIQQLPPNADTSVDTWLDNTPYPLWRKQELRMTWSKVGSIWEDERYMKCKSFQKDEPYTEYKHARAINSRSDEFKCAVGPIFKLIEKQVFCRDEFIKKIPVNDRPKYIMERLFSVGSTYIATDYTAFESLFVKDLMDACEFELYDYVTEHLPEHDEFMRLNREIIAGTNVCKFKNFTVKLEATRMSGEMCTSLGNGFSNLMFLLFVCDRLGSEAIAVVEGDDCAARIIGKVPSSQDFSRIGLNIKLEVHRSLSEMSFCGLVFDVDDLHNVTDPREVLAGFGWATSQYAQARDSKKRGLLRCKALSLAYQYPGCPILSALSRYGLRVTRGQNIDTLVDRWQNLWEREQLLEAVSHPVLQVEVGMRTRLLVQKLYNIPIEHQTMLENWLDGLTELQPLDHPLLELHMKPVWQHYYREYCLPCKTSQPIRHWSQVPEYRIPIPLSAF